MAGKIFNIIKITFEYEDYDMSGKTYNVKKEMLFQKLTDAQNYMWNEYRNAHKKYCINRERRGKNYDSTVKKFDENKMEYEYLDGEERIVKAKIEWVDVNHYPIRFKKDGTGYLSTDCLV